MSEHDQESVVGEIAKAIPESAWNKIVDAACRTFESAMAPITATSGGVGRLLTEKFDRLAALEKIQTAEVVQAALKKAKLSGKEIKHLSNPRVMLDLMKESACLNDETLKELWSNLLAQEITRGGTHPEIPRTLARLTAEDARLLSEINSSKHAALISRMLFMSHSREERPSNSLLSSLYRRKDELSHSVLSGLNLIQNEGSAWVLTSFGEAFVEAVTDPELQKAKNSGGT